MSARKSSWSKAFEYGGRFTVYAILWIIIGIALINYGTSALEASKYAISPFEKQSLEANGLFGIFFGLIILVAGVATAFFKVMLELIDETFKPAPPTPQA